MTNHPRYSWVQCCDDGFTFASTSTCVTYTANTSSGQVGYQRHPFWVYQKKRAHSERRGTLAYVANSPRVPSASSTVCRSCTANTDGWEASSMSVSWSRKAEDGTKSLRVPAFPFRVTLSCRDSGPNAFILLVADDTCNTTHDKHLMLLKRGKHVLGRRLELLFLAVGR